MVSCFSLNRFYLPRFDIFKTERTQPVRNGLPTLEKSVDRPVGQQTPLPQPVGAQKTEKTQEKATENVLTRKGSSQKTSGDHLDPQRSRSLPLKLAPGSLISGAWTQRTSRKHAFLLDDFEKFVLMRTEKPLFSSPSDALPGGFLMVSPLEIDEYLRWRRENPRAPTKTGENHCKWSHVQGILGNLLGAIRDAPIHGKKIILTDQADMVSKIDRTLRKRANVEPVLFPTPIKLTEVKEALQLIKMSSGGLARLAELYLLLWHQTAARPQDPLHLLCSNVVSLRVVNGRRVWSITFVEGKGVTIRGPYTVHTALLEDDLLSKALQTKQKYLFPEHTRTKVHEMTLQAIKAVNPALEQRSLRRGALQDLAATDTEENTLLTFSGHENAPMLWRYLGWGQRRGRAQITGAQAAIAAWGPVGNSL